MNSFKTVKLLVLLNLFGDIAFAQNETDNWYFGSKAGLNFSTCTPTILTNGQVNTLEGVATISDVNGNLLFYTDGIKVWNRNHLVMQNGTGLHGNSSSSQSAVIIPKPGSISLYYVFTVDDIFSNTYGLKYSIVDISQNAGLGNVITKNVPLLAEAWEKLTAVRHQNNTDFWIITRNLSSKNYYSWYFSAAGVSVAPVISESPNYIPFVTTAGYLKPSNDGKMLFCGFTARPFSEMAKFNTATGEVTNIIKFDNNVVNSARLGVVSSYGAEFSSDNKLLYVSSFYDANTGSNGYITQYNVTNFDSAAISNSKVFIDSGYTLTHPDPPLFWALQLAKNGKIYATEFDKKFLSVINNPNAPGSACNFQLDGQSLGIGFVSSQGGLPTFIQSYFNPNYRVYDFNYTEDCQLNVSFSLNTTYPYDSLRWNFGDIGSGISNTSNNPNQVHSYNSTGTRTVKLYIFNTYGCVNKIDSIIKQIPVGNQWFTLGADKLICQGDSLLLNATTESANTYTWSTGAITPTIKIYGAGTYWCEVTKGACSYRDSIIVTTKPLPMVNLGADQTLCEDQQLVLNAFNAGATYTWQNNSMAQNYTVTNAGQFYVKVDLNGCIKSDTIKIDYTLKPRFTLGSDKSICAGLSIILDPKIINVNYLWQNNTTSPTFIATQPGLYYLTASNSCGSKSDSVNITNGNCTVYFPNAFTPNGDNNNDIFKALFVDDVASYELQVYNRYGQVVFKTNDKSTGWNGKFNTIDQPNGMYVWIAKYSTLSKAELKEVKGTINLIR